MLNAVYGIEEERMGTIIIVSPYIYVVVLISNLFELNYLCRIKYRLDFSDKLISGYIRKEYKDSDFIFPQDNFLFGFNVHSLNYLDSRSNF